MNFAHNGYQLQIPNVVEEVTEAYRGQEDWLLLRFSHQVLSRSCNKMG